MHFDSKEKGYSLKEPKVEIKSSKNYDIDAIGISVQGYDTLIVFRDENAFLKVIAANPNIMAVMGAEDYTKKNFPGVFIAGIIS